MRNPKHHPCDVHVGRRVRETRKALRVNQSALADAIGVTFQQVQKYEQGDNRISASVLYRIAEALQTPIEYFFEGLDEFDTPARLTPEHHVQTLLASREGIEMVQLFTRLSLEQRKFVANTAKGLAAMSDKASK